MKNISKKLLVGLFSLSLITTLPSCSTLTSLLGGSQNAIPSFQQPKLSIKSFALGDVNIQEVNFKLTLNVENPNSVAIKTSDVAYNLDLAGTNIIKGSLTNGIDIKANSTTEMDIPLKVTTQSLLELAPKLIASITNLDYKAYGTINFDTPIGKLPLNWEKQDKINLTSLLSLLTNIKF